jgi:integrase
MTVKITKRAVDTAQASERDFFIWDSELKGFGLKVTPKGRKVYLVQYRMPGRTTRRYTIGPHGSPWTPSSARTEATRILGAVAAGSDPADDKKLARQDITVSELCDIYLGEGADTKKATTVAMDRSRINAHVRPLLGTKRVKQLSKTDVRKFLTDVADGKTAKDRKTRKQGRSIIKGGKGVANRTIGMLGAILEFAVERGYRSDNPARGVKKYREGRPARFLSNEEMARLGDALRDAEQAKVNLYAIAAIRLLLLTGCRKNEILSLKWTEVDFANGMLRLPDSKTGAKIVHLGAPAISLLSELPRQQGNSFVIAGDRAGHHLINLQKVWAKVREAAGLEDVRLHDLRHSFASMAARSGESLLVIGKVLGHATTAATSRYAHLSDDPVKAASEKTSNRIKEFLDGPNFKAL